MSFLLTGWIEDILEGQISTGSDNKLAIRELKSPVLVLFKKTALWHLDVLEAAETSNG